MADLQNVFSEIKAFNNSRNYDKVILALENVDLSNKDDKKIIANIYAEKAEAYHYLKELKLCKKAFKKALKIQSDNIKAIRYKAYFYNKNKNFKKAISVLEKAIRNSPKNVDLYISLGNIYNDSKKFDKAIEILETAVKHEPKHAILLNTLGDNYRDNGEPIEATKNYMLAIEYDENTIYPHNGLGDILVQDEKYDEAIEAFTKAIDRSELNDVEYVIEPYNNRANTYYTIKEYEKSSQDYLTYLAKKHKLSEPEVKNEFGKKNKSKIEINYYSSRAWSQYSKLELIIGSKYYKEINELIIEIKKQLKFDGGNITHYTSLSAAKELILKDSCFRLSEGVFLNDTSEGRELFDFLDFPKVSGNDKKTVSVSFSQKPFIGSFVPENGNNDLTLWRMYGKENKEEGKGCSLTLDMKNLLIVSNDKLIPKKEYFTSLKTNEDFNFYRIAYRQNSDPNNFKVPGCEDVESKLNELMYKLMETIEVFKKDASFNDITQSEITELLNEITFLFKSADYQYENEIRLIVNGDGITKITEYGDNKKVYIELEKINPFLKTITLGPKVDNADELAAIFHYILKERNIDTEVVISHIPFK